MHKYLQQTVLRSAERQIFLKSLLRDQRSEERVDSVY